MLADIIPKIAEQQMLDKGSTGFSKYSPRPSNSGPERCIRQMVYHAMGMPPRPLPGRSLLIFDDGIWHEELTRQWLAMSAFKVHSDQMGILLKGIMPWRTGYPRTCGVKVDGKKCGQVYDQADIHGHVDFIVQDIEGTDWLVEHKSSNRFSFNRIWEKNVWPLDYLTQMGLYFKGLIQVNPALTKGFLLIKCKDTAQYIEFETHYDPEADSIKIVRGTRSDGETYEVNFTFENVVKNTIEKFRLVEDVYIKEKTLPARPYFYSDKDGFPCGYCAWSETCWLGYEKELEQRGTIEGLQEFFEDCVRYLNLTKVETEAGKEKDEIKDRIKQFFIDNNLKEAQTVAHIITLDMRHRAASHTEAKDYEQLSIKAKKYGRVEDNRDKRGKVRRRLADYQPKIETDQPKQEG